MSKRRDSRAGIRARNEASTSRKNIKVTGIADVFVMRLRGGADLNDKASSPSTGAVVSVRGSVVDIRFENRLPPVYTLLRTGNEGRIAIEVLAQLDAHLVHGIALTPTEGPARGMAVEDTGGPCRRRLAGRRFPPWM